MMRRKILFIVVIAFVALVGNAFAQEIKIIVIQGDVLVRSRAIAPWKRAMIGETVYKDYEVLTKGRSKCTLSFDENVDNVITVEEHSQIKIADMLGRTIELSKGRVFSLIGSAKKTESFQIKTPTAIAGARGTGWMVAFAASTLAQCFQGTIYVVGLDEEGNRTSEQDIGEGSGIEVLSGGLFGDLFGLDNEDKEAWETFSGDVNGLKDSAGQEDSSDPDTEQPDQEIRNEQKDDLRDEKIRNERIAIEEPFGKE